MKDLREYHLKSELRERLAEEGIIGAAAEALLKETASYRHEWRIREACRTALALNVSNPAVGAAACFSDCYGIGGKDNVEGLATDRLPAFRCLGKGRKQASDGAAWTAAIFEAGLRLAAKVVGQAFPHLYSQPDAYVRIAARTRRLLFIVGVMDDDAYKPVRDWEFDSEVVPIAWQMTIARDGLRVSLGLPSWFYESRPTLVAEKGIPGVIHYEGTSADWAGVVNRLAAMECEGEN